MMGNNINIEIKGLDKILKALDKLPRQVNKYMTAAGREAANKDVLPTVGLQRYPPSTPANQPPPPYYIRGRGMQYKTGNNLSSERLGTQWYTKDIKGGVKLGNRASYAPYVHGQKQPKFMERKGWKKLFETAKEKRGDITATFQKWVNKAIRDLGL